MVKLKEEGAWGAILALSLKEMPITIEGVRQIGAMMGKKLNSVPKDSPEYKRLNYLLTQIGGIHQILQAADGMAHGVAVDLLGDIKDAQL